MGNCGKMVSGIVLIGILVQIACGVKQEREIRQLSLCYGYQQSDSVAVYLTPTDYASFDTLRARVEEIVCHDSLPIIEINTSPIKKFISLHKLCWSAYDCILIRRNNILRIENDTIAKSELKFPLDSLYPVMKRDYYNNGRDLSFSISPKKMVVFIGVQNHSSISFANLLDTITTVYDSLNIDTELRIWLDRKWPTLPPPPPPLISKVN